MGSSQPQVSLENAALARMKIESAFALRSNAFRRAPQVLPQEMLPQASFGPLVSHVSRSSLQDGQLSGVLSFERRKPHLANANELERWLKCQPLKPSRKE